MEFFLELARQVSVFCMTAILEQIGLAAAASSVVEFLEDLANRLIRLISLTQGPESAGYDRVVYRRLAYKWFKEDPEGFIAYSEEWKTSIA